MAKKRVSIAYITNDSERKASFKKRKKGLIKKVSELSTLCGVDACAIIYGENDAEPEVWPSREGAQAILARFRNLSDIEKQRKMVNQEGFLGQRIKKAKEQLDRANKESRFRQVQNFMFQCISGAINLRDCKVLPGKEEMNWVIKQTIWDIESRMEALKSEKRSGREELPGSASTSGSTDKVVPPPSDTAMEGGLRSKI